MIRHDRDDDTTTIVRLARELVDTLKSGSVDLNPENRRALRALLDDLNDLLARPRGEQPPS
jgi:hypothetical protein